MKKLLLMVILLTGCTSDKSIIETTKGLTFENGISVERYADEWLTAMAIDDEYIELKNMPEYSWFKIEGLIEDGDNGYFSGDVNIPQLAKRANNIVNQETNLKIEWSLEEDQNKNKYVLAKSIDKKGRTLIVEIFVDVFEDSVSTNYNKMTPYSSKYSTMENRKELAERVFAVRQAVEKYYQ